MRRIDRGTFDAPRAKPRAATADVGGMRTVERVRRRGIRLAVHLLVGLSFGGPASAQPIFSEYVEGLGQDKAVELWNPTDAAIDLGARGVRVEIYFNGATTPARRVALSGVLEAGGVFVLAHASADAALVALADQLVSGSLFGGDDALVLVDANGVLDAVGQVGADPGTEWGDVFVGTEDGTLRRATGSHGDTDPFDAFDPSRDWFGVALGDFGDLGMAPGWRPAPAAPGEIRIHDVQGRAHLSPYEGRLVALVPGVVTATQTGGFYMQDPEPDADPATSEALFVYAPDLEPVAVGESVLVSGRVSEYRPGSRAKSLSITQIVASSVVAVTDPGAVRGVEPEVLGLSGRAIPTAIIDDDTRGSVEAHGETVFDPERDGIDFYESLEAMWVVVPGTQVVGPTDRFGEIWLVADEGRGATGMNAAGGITLRDGDSHPERIRASDAFFTGGMPPFDVGARLGTLSGVVSYSFGSYDLRLFDRPLAVSSELPAEGTTLVGDRRHVTVATLNVENLDPKVERRDLVGSARDIDDDIGSGRLGRIAAQIVDALASPDVLALQEVQDGDGAERTGRTCATPTYEALVGAIAEAGGPEYAFTDVAPIDGADGGQPGGNIRVGFLFRVDRVALRASRAGPGGPLDVARFVERGRGPELANNPARLRAASAADALLFAGTRKTIVAQFDPLDRWGFARPNRTFFVVNAHFASRAGSSPAYGPTQPPSVRGEEVRAAQARAIARFTSRLLERAPRARIVVAGDLNAPGFLPPLDAFDDAGLVDLVADRLAPVERYTYVFEGASQDLDHVLVPASLVSGTEVEIVHLNAEYAARATDHDPIVVRIDVGRASSERAFFGFIAALFEWIRALFAR
jgi:uncharacterized protein